MAKKKEEVVLLALDYTTDWYKLFRGCKTSSGIPIRVEQSEWKDLHVEARYTAVPSLPLLAPPTISS